MFSIKDIVCSVWYALLAYRLNWLTGKMYDGNLSVHDVFRVICIIHEPEKDTQWYKHETAYITPRIRLPNYYDLTIIVDPNTWKCVKNELNVASVAIVYATYEEDAVGEANADQRKH